MAARSASTDTWETIQPAPIVLVSGGESVFISRSVARIHQRAGDDDTDTMTLDASHYTPGSLMRATEPSLFSTRSILTITAVEKCTDDFLAEALDYVDSPQPESVVIFLHAGGNRAARLLKAIKTAGYPVVAAQGLKYDNDRQQFAKQEFTRAKRRIQQEALYRLLQVAGSDLSELVAAIDQLISDTTGTITPESVEKYFGKWVEASAFKVVDAAIIGKTGEALGLLRYALRSGTDPVPLVAAFATKVRSLAKVSARSGSSASLAAELGMAPWQIDRARKEIRYWDGVRLARAIIAVAEADEAVKGGQRDAEYAVEKLVHDISYLTATSTINIR